MQPRVLLSYPLLWEYYVCIDHPISMFCPQVPFLAKKIRCHVSILFPSAYFIDHIDESFQEVRHKKRYDNNRVKWR